MPVGPLDSRRGQIALVAVLAVAAGAVLAPQVYSSTSGPDGTVAVIELEGTIDESTAQFVEGQLRDARRNDSIKAVVLEVNSPGGLPAQSERIYAAVERTSQQMPVIAAVDTLGASGAYLSIVPADDIYVAPSAQAVGSVGVTGTAPQPLTPSAGDTGPNKGSTHPDDARANRETLANLFLESVMTQRGDEIELSREEVSRANVYLGTEAVENGFADELGFVSDAINDAANRAGLDSYEVDTRRAEQQQNPLSSLPLQTEDGRVVVGQDQKTLNGNLILAVAPQYVDEVVPPEYEVVYHSGEYVPEAARQSGSSETAPTQESTAEQGGDEK
ncbi:S49 family peptidase [Halovenus sp. WSH3]|uniref:S49 family peptidase n=1 Tax=Halovenus carboxidivorans TaxID=2692199 RepID=A0A6B0TCB7_9EURY|nr:S49 family peptidase [Halovenus carboxidivorans]MXR53042.1 S49 family peptidase [Halovenus carboxidivorans]